MPLKIGRSDAFARFVEARLASCNIALIDVLLAEKLPSNKTILSPLKRVLLRLNETKRLDMESALGKP